MNPVATSSSAKVRRCGVVWVAVTGMFLALWTVDVRGATPDPGEAIPQELKAFNEWGSVLHVAAHPDDENTQLITYLALGRHYRTAYLSLTRGDGGQNLLGPEFGEQLGVIRTQELLAARHLDGGRQFFTRAVDFGFSKDVRQTLQYWDRGQVVGDIVRVMRTFRPDVVITRFSTVPGTTHGHHTASAVLALEAFKLAGDANAYPEQLKTLSVWQPKRIFMNSGGFGPAPARGGASAAAIRMDIGGTDPVSGDSFSAIAGRSRAMHKTQGFGNFGGGRGGAGGGARNESFQLLAGEPATQDILDGVDTSWARVAGGAEIGKLTSEVIGKFNRQDPAASVPALLEIHARRAALPDGPLLGEKRRQLDRIIQECLGLSVETVAGEPEVVPGEAVKLRHTATVRSAVRVKWVGVKYAASPEQLKDVVELHRNEAATRVGMLKLPGDMPLTQPYWLREAHEPGMFTVSDSLLIGLPEAPSSLGIEQVFEVGGQRIVVADEPVHLTGDQSKGGDRYRLDVIPPVSIALASEVRLFAPGGDGAVEVKLTGARAGVAGKLELQAPAGWKVSPANRTFRLDTVGQSAAFTFTVTAPAEGSVGGIVASVEVGGVRYSNRRIEIRYAHVPPQLLQPVARIKAVCAPVAIRGRQVGYLPGAGDSVAEALRQMGYEVSILSVADLNAQRLKGFDAVVIGVRAFNVHADLGPRLNDLFAYVEGGGNVIEQYNTPNDIKVPRLAPFDVKLSGNLPRNRVTDPKAAITLLAPDHPALNTPNRIAPADFEGWVQERGLNFPIEWDQEHWTAILACNDAGEAPLKSGLLVARYGRGYYVYTGLSFFRQLPAGVPGAYRLFANLVSLGK
ncbi:MAG TPA: PIG-L family deacetylase [Tepidisphaeraceae bacterium]